MKKTDDQMLLSAINRSLRINIEDRIRLQDYAFARFIYFYYLRKFTGMSLKDIGNSCGGRDHATAYYGSEEFLNLVNDPKFQKIHDRCVSKINKTKRFPKIKRLTPKPKRERKSVEYRYKKNEVKEVIRKSFLSNGITNDIMEMTNSEIQELITNKVKPHIIMLRSRKKQ